MNMANIDINVRYEWVEFVLIAGKIWAKIVRGKIECYTAKNDFLKEGCSVFDNTMISRSKVLEFQFTPLDICVVKYEKHHVNP